MPNHLSDKTALVTGAAKRVGRAIALRLAQEGMHVAFTYNTSSTEAQETAHRIEQLSRRAHAIQADLTQPDAIDRVFDAFSQRFGSLYALVNNASLFLPTPLGQITPDSFHRHIAVNALAPLLLTQRFAPLLAASYKPDDPATAGRIVNLLDTQPHRNHAAYNASKAALMQITQTTALELAPKITVNAVAPGVVDWAPGSTPEQQHRYLARVPLNRAGTPEDAAATVAFLIRDAHYCTGQTIRVDGGRSLA